MFNKLYTTDADIRILHILSQKYYALHRCHDDPLIVILQYLRHFNNYCFAVMGQAGKGASLRRLSQRVQVRAARCSSRLEDWTSGVDLNLMGKIMPHMPSPGNHRSCFVMNIHDRSALFMLFG